MEQSALLFDDFATAHADENGWMIATTISPEPPKHDPGRLYKFRNINAGSIRTDLQYKLQYNPVLRIDKKEAQAWLEVFVTYHKFVACLLQAEEAQTAGKVNNANWSKVYDDWKEVVNILYRGYTGNSFAAWTIPCLYVAGRYLRIFAIKADEELAIKRDSGMAFGGILDEDAFDASSKNDKLEDAGRQINRVFALCLGDRAPLEDSRKWALYYVAVLLFKTHFKLNHISLSKNILKSIYAGGNDMPPFDNYPKSHQVAFKYYVGVIHFLEEDYAAAEEHLTAAYRICHATASPKNVRLILTYLIPTKLLTSQKLPSKAMLSHDPELNRLFRPVCDAIRRGDLKAFTEALESGEDEFVKRRIYLTLERGRDMVLRNIFRKVFLASGYEPAKEGDTAPPQRRTRIPIDEFAAALQISGAEVGDGNGGIDTDEVECLLANAIYKSLMKGYIAREARKVVLSKGGAFPGTGV